MFNKPQKIIMLGESYVGKTAILQTFINKKFPDKTTPTFGSSFHRITFIDAEGQQVLMDLWDTAGQQKYRSLLTLYYKNSDGVIITFDMSNQTTFQAVNYWTQQLQQNCEFPPYQPQFWLVISLIQFNLGKVSLKKQQINFLQLRKIGSILSVVPSKGKIFPKYFKLLDRWQKRLIRRERSLKQERKTRRTSGKGLPLGVALMRARIGDAAELPRLIWQLICIFQNFNELLSKYLTERIQDFLQMADMLQYSNVSLIELIHRIKYPQKEYYHLVLNQQYQGLVQINKSNKQVTFVMINFLLNLTIILLYLYLIWEGMDMSQENSLHHQVKVNSETQTNNSALSLIVANFSIQQLLRQSFQSIKHKQLLTHYPQFTHIDLMSLLDQFINQSTPSFGTSKPSQIFEEDQSQIIKIQRDNLSPKQLLSQHPQKDEVVKDLDFLSSTGSKKLNMTNRSSFLKRKASQISQLPSGTATQRTTIENNVLIKSKKVSPQKIQKSVSTKKDPLLNFTSLNTPQDEDPQIIHLRQKALFYQKEKQKQQKLQNLRIKEDHQKFQSFNSQYGGHKLFTFDFEGQTIGSQTNKDQTINYYTMKVGVKTIGNKYRTIYKNLQTDNNQQNINEQKMPKHKLNQNKKSTLETSNHLNASFQIPLFQKQHSPFIPETDPSKLKILQYKRLYAKKFSRYDKNSTTLDLSSVLDKKITEDDFFTSKRHLTDSNSINKSRSSSVNKEYVPRKLALPRLQGKYKVLDRYDQI